MNLRAVMVAVLLWAGVGTELLCVLGMLAFHEVADRLHYTGPSALGAVLIVTALLVHESFSVIGLKAILLAAFLLFTTPVLAHATARAIRINERGDWRLGEGEAVEIEGNSG